MKILSGILASYLAIAALSLTVAAKVHAAPDVDAVERSIVRVVIGGHGTGWVVSPGVVATNWHVAEGQTTYDIIPAGTSETYRGTLRWIGNSERDIALIDVPGLPLEPFTIHTGDPRRASQSYTVGFPGLGDDLTGRANTNVSVYGGTIALVVENSAGVKIIQHTNIVNAGNSGGPLLDNCGRVLGLTTWGVENQQYQADFIWASVHVSELARQMDSLGISYQNDPSACVDAAAGTVNFDTTALDSQLSTQSQALSQQEAALSQQEVALSEQSKALEQVTRQIYTYGSAGAVLLALTLALALRRPRQQIVHALGSVSRKITGFQPERYTDRAVGRPAAPAKSGLTLSGSISGRNISLPLEIKTLANEAHGISLGRQRDLVDFCLEDPTVSRRHLRFSLNNSSIEVEDLNSSGGTYLNGKQLLPFRKAAVKVGDRLKLGNVELWVSQL
ncbi:MAG: trypsin-like peptidase domain-containing protein [Pseudohongiella sp.]|nr:trypsin-like peptidase domain-containing protein [Pseudohongiella sp.]